MLSEYSFFFLVLSWMSSLNVPPLCPSCGHPSTRHPSEYAPFFPTLDMTTTSVLSQWCSLPPLLFLSHSRCYMFSLLRASTSTLSSRPPLVLLPSRRCPPLFPISRCSHDHCPVNQFPWLPTAECILGVLSPAISCSVVSYLDIAAMLHELPIVFIPEPILFDITWYLHLVEDISVIMCFLLKNTVLFSVPVHKCRLRLRARSVTF